MFVSKAPLAQWVKRGTNNGKVMCSRLIRIRSHFLFELLSLFKHLAYIHCIKIVNLECIFSKWYSQLSR